MTKPKSDKMTNREIALATENETIGYLIQCYISPEDILDPKMAKLFKQARDLLTEIETLLEKELDEYDCEEDTNE